MTVEPPNIDLTKQKNPNLLHEAPTIGETHDWYHDHMCFTCKNYSYKSTNECSLSWKSINRTNNKPQVAIILACSNHNFDVTKVPNRKAISQEQINGTVAYAPKQPEVY